MLKERAADFIELGEHIHDTRLLYQMDKYFEINQIGERTFNLKGAEELRNELRGLMSVAQRLSLITSVALIDRRLGYRDDALPSRLEEFDIIVEFLKEELSSRLFLFVPSHLTRYYEWTEIVSNKVMRAFPKTSEEIRIAGTAHAAGLNTAAVFHAMRAAESGVRSLGTAMKVTLAHSIELADQQAILTAVQGKISEIGKRPRSAERDSDMEFFSQAAAQLQFFKDGWRVRLAHGRASYNESQARDVIDHVRAFFEIVADRLKE